MGTFTPNLGLYKPSDKERGWGAAVDTNWDVIDGLVLAFTVLVTGNYTLVLADRLRVVEVNSGSPAVVTVPPNSSVAFPVGAIVELCQIGVGQVTIAAGGGVTIDSPGGALKLATQFSVASLRKRGTNEWVLAGDITT